MMSNIFVLNTDAIEIVYGLFDTESREIDDPGKLIKKEAGIYYFDYIFDHTGKPVPVALTHTGKRKYATIKDSVLGMIQRRMCSLNKLKSCPSVSKEFLGIIAFLLYHCRLQQPEPESINNILEALEYNNVLILKENEEAIETILTTISNISGVDDLSVLYTLSIGSNGRQGITVPEKTIENILKGENAIKRLLISDLVLKAPGVAINYSRDFQESDPNHKQAIQKLFSYLTNQFKFSELRKADNVNINANANINVSSVPFAIQCKFISNVMSQCDPFKCTHVREDDIVLGTPFIEYTMDQINSLINIHGHCYSVQYLANLIMGTRGRIETFIKGVLINENIIKDIVDMIANYYAVAKITNTNVRNVLEDIESPTQFFTGLEIQTLKDGLKSKLNITERKSKVEGQNIINLVPEFKFLKIFFNYMLMNFQTDVAASGMKEIYINSNGLILDLIGYTGYVCLSDHIEAQVDSTVEFPCAQHCLTKLQNFVSNLNGLDTFTANGDSFAQIMNDIPITCIHGIGMRMTSFYIACFNQVGKMLRNGMSSEVKSRLMFTPSDYTLDDAEYEEMISELLTPANFVLQTTDETGVYYSKAITYEFNPDYHPLAKMYLLDECKHDGTASQWFASCSLTSCFKTNQPKRLRDFFQVASIKPLFKPVNGIPATSKSVIRIAKHLNRIMFIAENLQKDRKQIFDQLLQHTKDVSELISFVRNRSNIDERLFNYISEPTLFRNIVTIVKPSKGTNGNKNKKFYRTFDTVMGQWSKSDTSDKFIVKNAYSEINSGMDGDGITEQAMNMRLVAKVIKPLKMKSLYRPESGTTHDVQKIIQAAKDIYFSLNSAITTVLKVSHHTDLNVFGTLKVKVGDVILSKQNMTGIQTFKRNNGSDHVMLLIADTIQNINASNACAYCIKLYEASRNTKNNALFVLYTRVIRRMMNVYAMSKYFINTYEQGYGVNFNLRYPQPTGNDITDVIAIYYYWVYYAWMKIINPEFDERIISTQQFHIDNVIEDFIPLQKLWNSAQPKKSNAKYSVLSDSSDCSASIVYNNTLDFLNSTYSYYNQQPLQINDNQEAVPRRIDYTLKSNAANAIESMLIIYESSFIGALNSTEQGSMILNREDLDEILENNNTQIFVDILQRVVFS